MTTIIGMAKSPLDLRGAKDRNLRLDVELLARRIAELRGSGQEAIGYLLVLADGVARRARGWDVVSRDPNLNVIVADLPEEDLEALREEKRRNAQGIRSGRPFDSVAALGRRLAEGALRSEIRKRHPGIRRTSDTTGNANWDFFGVLDERHGKRK